MTVAWWSYLLLVPAGLALYRLARLWQDRHR